MTFSGKAKELYDYGVDEELRHKQNIEWGRGLVNFVMGCLFVVASFCAGLITLILIILGKIKL